jgi:hypothetical protein
MKSRSAIFVLCLTVVMALFSSGCGILGVGKDAAFRKKVAADKFPSADKSGVATKSSE